MLLWRPIIVIIITIRALRYYGPTEPPKCNLYFCDVVVVTVVAVLLEIWPYKVSLFEVINVNDYGMVIQCELCLYK